MTLSPPRARLLMLHGNAGDEALMQLQLQASGWWGATAVEFVCVTAPHQCAPKPELFQAMSERGLYEKPSYYTWGLEDAARTAASVEHVQRLLQEKGCVGVGGICDGSLVAALVALQTREVYFYLNCCAGPPSMLASACTRAACCCALPYPRC